MKPVQTAVFAMLLLGMPVLAFVHGVSPSWDKDEQEILDHVHSIFKAYMEADLETIRATHSEDWTGFNNQSRMIVRGIDGYMDYATAALSRSRVVRYELEDVEVKIRGEVGIVYYVANWTSQANGSDVRFRMRVRCVDVYEKRSGRWIQTGSNLNVLPRAGAMTNPQCGACFDVGLEQ